MRRLTCLAICFSLWIPLSFADGYSLKRVEPPSWWIGMHDPVLQLMVCGEQIADLTPVIRYPGVRIQRTERTGNPNYLFITLKISPDAKPGRFDILFQKDKTTQVLWHYELWEREPGSAQRIGFGPSDVIYLVTPDRFANGDPSNDEVSGYPDKLNRDDRDGRHGGDLQGIIDHLDYIAGMGFTALWLNPVLENNMPRTSYHGYAITDFYRVDPRFGSNELYAQLGEMASRKGIKLIMDMVANHCGSEHWWMKDLPSEDWIHGGGEFFSTNHMRATVQDPYASPSDKMMFPDGWFVKSMPDMNQQNPFLATYLIQNSVWWIEYAHLAGIRQDTYSYPDKDFMSEWSCRLMAEYPRLNIVGEEWSVNPALVSYWQKGKVNRDGYTSCLPSLMDFPLQQALVKGLVENDAIYSDGLIRLYETLANDFLYADPGNLVIFADNHDMSRFFTQVDEDVDLFKMGLVYILTVRGISQVYYGTEIAMNNPGTSDHGIIRSDFPGGWESDTVDAFSGKGLTQQQTDIQDFTRKLLRWRQNHPVIHDGSLVHYVPNNGIYVYFRYTKDQTVMIVMNKNNVPVTLGTQRFSEVTGDFHSGKDVLTKKEYLLNDLVVPAREALILELQK